MRTKFTHIDFANSLPKKRELSELAQIKYSPSPFHDGGVVQEDTPDAPQIEVTRDMLLLVLARLFFNFFYEKQGTDKDIPDLLDYLIRELDFYWVNWTIKDTLEQEEQDRLNWLSLKYDDIFTRSMVLDVKQFRADFASHHLKYISDKLNEKRLFGLHGEFLPREYLINNNTIIRYRMDSLQSGITPNPNATPPLNRLEHIIDDGVVMDRLDINTIAEFYTAGKKLKAYKDLHSSIEPFFKSYIRNTRTAILKLD